MTTKPILRLALLAAALALAACGNKGPLVHPDKTASPASDAKPAPAASPASDNPASSPAG